MKRFCHACHTWALHTSKGCTNCRAWDKTSAEKKGFHPRLDDHARPVLLYNPHYGLYITRRQDDFLRFLCPPAFDAPKHGAFSRLPTVEQAFFVHLNGESALLRLVFPLFLGRYTEITLRWRSITDETAHYHLAAYLHAFMSEDMRERFRLEIEKSEKIAQFSAFLRGFSAFAAPMPPLSLENTEEEGAEGAFQAPSAPLPLPRHQKREKEPDFGQNDRVCPPFVPESQRQRTFWCLWAVEQVLLPLFFVLLPFLLGWWFSTCNPTLSLPPPRALLLPSLPPDTSDHMPTLYCSAQTTPQLQCRATPHSTFPTDGE